VVSLQIIRKPNTELYNIYSMIVEAWLFDELITKQQVFGFYIERAEMRAIDETSEILDKAYKENGKSPHPGKKTWDEAELRNRVFKSQ